MQFFSSWENTFNDLKILHIMEFKLIFGGTQALKVIKTKLKNSEHPG